MRLIYSQRMSTSIEEFELAEEAHQVNPDVLLVEPRIESSVTRDLRSKMTNNLCMELPEAT